MVATQDVIDASTDPGEGVRPPRADAYNRFLNWLGIAIVAVCCIYVFIELQPRLLFLNTTPTGGDTGAHVWFPAFLRDHLLPWRVAGWSDASYAGFPAGQFYFPFPALLIVLLDTVLPYNIAFKLVTALGPVLMPIGAYVFGRGIRVPRPAAPLFAVGATAFLFFKDGGDATMRYDHHIMGGTLTNTLAGEYSFTIAVACALLFLGTLAMALESRRRLWIPALFIAATLTSHLVVGVFAFVGAVVIWLCSRPWKSTGRAVAIGAVGVALTAAWLVPLAATLKYTTDMRYEPVGTGYTDPWLLGRLGIELPTSFDWLFLSEMWFLFLFGIVAIGAGIAYRRRSTLIVGAMTFLAGTVFCGWELLRDILGKAPGVEPAPAAVLVPDALPARGARRRGDRALDRTVRPLGRARRPTRRRAGSRRRGRGARRRGTGRGARKPPKRTVTSPPASSSSAWSRHCSPRSRSCASTRPRATSPTGPSTTTPGTKVAPSRTRTKKDYAEYRAFIDTVSALPPGRLLWEPSSDIGRYGTPLALMMLPYWTDGRISSMEGLYYESSATTPYHFLTAATLTSTPSNAVRGLPYRNSTDFALGVRYLQLMGVRYYAAMPDMQALASTNPSLREVATVPDLDVGAPLGWKIYEVADSPVVSPLRFEPVVARDLHADENWRCEAKPEPAAGHAGRRRAERVGVPGRPLVRRPRRARPAAHRRRARELAAVGDARCASSGEKGASRREGHECASRRRLDLVRRVPHRRPGDGEVVVLPELAGRRGRRPVPGHAQLHGRRPHQPAREPHLRHDLGGVAGAGRDAGRIGGSRGPRLVGNDHSE